MRRLNLGAISLVVLAGISCWFIKTTHATAMLISEGAAGAWINENTDLTIDLLRVNTVDTGASYWNIPCENTVHEEYSPSYGVHIIDDCAQTTTYGKVGVDIRLGDSKIGYTLRGPEGNVLSSYFAIPRTNDLLLMSGENLYVYRNFPENFQIVKNLGVPQYIQLTQNPWGLANKVHFSDGSAFAGFQPGSFNFSGDGEHISLNQGRYQVVVDLDKLSAQTFGTTSMRPWGTTPQMHTAISSNGRIAFTADSDFDRYFLYDLDSCVGDGVDQARDCKKRDLYDILHDRVPGLKFVTTSRFISDTTIEFYAVVAVGDQTQTNRYNLNMYGGDVYGLDYIALGDSYTWGEGARNYKDGTDTDKNTCHVSRDSYPYVIKSILSLTEAESVACSGAKLKDIYTENEEVYDKRDAQALGKKENHYNQDILTNFLPGYRTQDRFVGVHRPKNITLSVSGNDIGFGEIVKKCVMPGNCYQSDSEKAEIVTRIKSQFPRLVNTYQKTLQLSPSSKIYVFGYPYLADSGAQCALNVQLTSNERRLAEELITDINRVVELAAARAGVRYIDVSRAFVGHRLCEAPPWDAAMNGILLDVGRKNFIASETYHPNKLGHQLMAKTILKSTNNFMTEMPLADQSITIDQMQSALLPALDTVSSPTPYLEKDISKYVIEKGETIRSVIRPEEYLLETGAQYKVEVHSSADDIGVATVINADKIKVDATIPANAYPGPETIHIYGKDINGNPIDIYKPILIIGPTNDIDGDGVLDNIDPCLFVSSSGIDADKDGTDDACDDEITRPPTPLSEDRDDQKPDVSPGGLRQDNPPPNYTTIPESENLSDATSTSQTSKGVSLGQEVGADTTMLKKESSVSWKAPKILRGNKTLGQILGKIEQHIATKDPKAKDLRLSIVLAMTALVALLGLAYIL